MKIKQILSIILTFIISTVLTFAITTNKKIEPSECYRVYLDGKVIGLIKSKNELESYINIQQDKLKEQYNVDKIYIPNNINVIKDITYDKSIDTVESIYNKINDIAPFTIKAYTITIDRSSSTTEAYQDEEKIVTLNVISKEIFKNAVEQVVLSFVDEENYQAYIKGEELKIETTGEVVDNIYIEDKITIKENNISTSDKIYMDEKELTKYLIFGNNDSTKIYTVSQGDTISSIAFNNKMSTNELLIANSQIKEKDTLLYVGQKLTIGSLKPLFSTVVERNVVEDEINKYKTEYTYDNSLSTGTVLTIQEGTNGVNRISKMVKHINGELVDGYVIKSEELVPTVNKIIKKRKTARGDGEWLWPTIKPYMITSEASWRWGRIHYGLDIIPATQASRRCSPIYAARDGVVTGISINSSSGHFVVIKHDNGYYTRYAHLSDINRGDSLSKASSATKYIKVGDRVKAGQRIGDMGNSGGSFGIHLHFEIWDGVPFAGNANYYNPRMFY